MAEPRRRLLEPNELAESGPVAEAVLIPLDLVDPSPRNPRAKLLEVDQLAESIRTFGLLQAITLRRADDRFEVVGGHRRWAAFLELHEQYPFEDRWRAIPARIVTADDDTGYLMLIASQVHNLGWKPREEAAALERLVLTGKNLKEIGQSLQRAESSVSKRLRVYSDSILSAYVQTGRLSTTVAEEMLTLGDPETKREYAERAVAEGWSQSTARAEVKRLALERQLREVGKRAHELLDLLSSVDAARIPAGAATDLYELSRRIQAMARGTAPRMPTIAEADARAGVTEQAKARAETKRRAATISRRRRAK